MESSSAKRSGSPRAGPIAMVVVGAVGLALLLVATIAVWAANEAVTDLLTATITTLVTPLERAEAGLQEVNTKLDSAQGAVQQLQDTVATIGVNLKGDSVVLRALGSLVGEDLKATVDRALQALERVRSTVATIDGILKGLDRIPLVTLPNWVQDMSAAIDELGRVGQQIQETVASLEALRTGAIEKAVTSVTEKATALEDRLTNVQTRTLAAEATVSNLLTTVKDWQSRLPGLIDLVSVLLTVFLLLMGLGQWVLVSLGWSFLKVGAWIPFYPLNRGVRPA